jgi:Flp pilus assembly protein TadG
MRISWGHRRRGAAAAELALWLPFLTLLLAVGADFARVFYFSQVLEQAAWSGAMYASGAALYTAATGTPEAAGQQAACREAAGLVPPVTAEQVTVTRTNTTTTVTVDYDYTMITPLLDPSGTVHVRRSVTLPKAPRPGQ